MSDAHGPDLPACPELPACLVSPTPSRDTWVVVVY